ncbi:hypothetical protein D3C87_1227090 [compost metagenome]
MGLGLRRHPVIAVRREGIAEVLLALALRVGGGEVRARPASAGAQVVPRQPADPTKQGDGQSPGAVLGLDDLGLGQADVRDHQTPIALHRAPGLLGEGGRDVLLEGSDRQLVNSVGGLPLGDPELVLRPDADVLLERRAAEHPEAVIPHPVVEGGLGLDDAHAGPQDQTGLDLGQDGRLAAGLAVVAQRLRKVQEVLEDQHRLGGTRTLGPPVDQAALHHAILLGRRVVVLVTGIPLVDEANEIPVEGAGVPVLHDDLAVADADAQVIVLDHAGHGREGDVLPLRGALAQEVAAHAEGRQIRGEEAHPELPDLVPAREEVDIRVEGLGVLDSFEEAGNRIPGLVDQVGRLRGVLELPIDRGVDPLAALPAGRVVSQDSGLGALGGEREERALDQGLPQLLGLREAREHLEVDLVDRAAANRVMRLVLEDEIPTFLPEAVLVAASRSPGEGRQGLNVVLPEGLAFRVELLEVHARGEDVGKQVGTASLAQLSGDLLGGHGAVRGEGLADLAKPDRALGPLALDGLDDRGEIGVGGDVIAAGEQEDMIVMVLGEEGLEGLEPTL